MAENKKAPDWAQIEVDYRAGVKPLRQIAEEHGITHGAVNKRAKRDGWSRDLKAAIVAKAEEKVSKAAVSTEVSNTRVVTERQVVEANAELQYQVRMEHRADIKRTRRLFASLLQELEVASTPEGIDLIETMFDIVHGSGDSLEGDPDDKAGKARYQKLLETLHRALSTGGRITSAKTLTEMLEKLVKLERQAFGIDDDDKGGSDVDKLLAKIHGELAGS